MTDYEMRKLAKMQAEFLVEALRRDDELLDLMFPPKLLDIQEAAEYLRMPVGTLYHKVDEIPHSKVGRRLVFTERGLTRWVKRTGSDESGKVIKMESEECDKKYSPVPKLNAYM